MKRVCSIFLTCVFLLGLLPTAALAAEGEVSYLYCDENGQNWQTGTKTSGDYTLVTADDTAWGASDSQEHWYVASGDVTISSRGTVTGDVHLILSDGCNLTVYGGINVIEGNSLTIYAQSTGNEMGKLIATHSANSATIGGGYGRTSGTITINGGVVTATNTQTDGSGGAGIGGGGNSGAGGTTIINGGRVQATSQNGAGIGGGGGIFGGGSAYGGSGGTIIINGGSVTANSIGGGNGSGSASGGSGGTITVSGGTVTATRIGGGNNNDSDGQFSTGDNGNAVIFTINILGGTADKTNWNGVIFEGNAGKVYGDVTITTDAEIPAGKTLTIDRGQTLTIDNGVTLTNNGTINVESGGKLVGNVAGSGEVNLLPPAEQFPALTPGNTYWFDLSGAGIPGTVNTALPDGSFHWVPFTYTGTINAYVLNSASSGQTNASADAAQATTASGTYGYTYDHSLFIADYAVTNNMTWNDLNASEKNMIFGTLYTSGGVSYTMRVPSVGNSSTGSGDSVHGTPQNNEWDVILDNNTDYIKNCNLYSWGQDTGYPSFRAVRGCPSARGWYSLTASYRNVDVGFRPVLELPAPDALASGLKTVIVNLNGGKAGTTSTAQDGPVNIVVKSGGSFTAPGSEGLTRPDGNTGSYFGWQGDDGSVYAAGAEIPAEVNSLTAIWAKEPTPTIEIDYAAETLAGFDASGSYTINGTSVAPTDGTLAAGGYMGQTISIVRKGDGSTTADSEKQTLDVPARPDAPAGLQGVNTGFTGGRDGKITGVSSDMEYKLSTDNSWTACTGTEITGLGAGTYQVRVKATESSFASQTASVTLAEPSPSAGFCLNDGSIEIVQSDGGLVVRQNGITYLTDGNILITGNGQSTNNTISVQDATAHVTLSGVDMSGVDMSGNTFQISNSNVTLTLEGDNTILADICGIDLYDSDLTIDGSGSLTIGSEESRAFCGISVGDHGGSNVTVNGGTLNITAREVAIGSQRVMVSGSDDAPSITINGGTVNADVSDGYGIGIGTRKAMQGVMDIAITGGTVNLTGEGNKISAKGFYPGGSNSSSVTITGGSVAAGGVTPQAANGTGDPVYPVTVSGRSGVVDALAIKGADGAVSYGRPDTAPEGGMTLYLPVGEYTGTAIIDGKLVTFDCTVSADGTGNASTMTDTGVQITTPEGEKPTINEDGTVTVPGGSTVQTGDNGPEITVGDQGGAVDGDGSITVPDGGTIKVGDTTVTLPDGGTVDSDGGITVPEGGTIQIGDTVITPPAGEAVTPNEDGTVTVPGGSTVQTGDGPEITVGDQGGAVDGDGSITVPDGGTIKVGDTTVTLPDGGTVDSDGGITVPEDGTIQIGDTVITPPAGEAVIPNDDGTVTVPGGSTVQTGDGQEITVGDKGGTLDPATGKVTENVHTVTFDSQGGSAVNSATATHGGTVTKPADPTRSGYTFGGWFKESGCTTAWNFDTDTVTGDITLYAKWTQSSGGSGGYTPPSKPDVSVDGNGGKVTSDRSGTVTITPDEGYQIEKITVNGKEVEIPADGKLTGLKPSDKVVVTFTKIPAVTVEQFTDVAPGAWYYDAVKYAVDHGLFYGTSDVTFSPNSTMTRGMLVTVLYRMESEPEADPADFLDVESGKYYSEAVAWAAANGIVAGYGNGNFGPEDAITREQLAAILYRYSGSPASAGTLTAFTDADKASGYALDALRWAVEQGIIQGKGNGILDPGGRATRAEVAAMLQRFCEKAGR